MTLNISEIIGMLYYKNRFGCQIINVLSYSNPLVKLYDHIYNRNVLYTWNIFNKFLYFLNTSVIWCLLISKKYTPSLCFSLHFLFTYKITRFVTIVIAISVSAYGHPKYLTTLFSVIQFSSWLVVNAIYTKLYLTNKRHAK
jgi:hypothetical protein